MEWVGLKRRSVGRTRSESGVGIEKNGSGVSWSGRGED